MTSVRGRGTETGFALGLAALFAALALAGVWRHEMWRDELEIWLIARGSAGLRELLVNMGTEGHPALWYVVTWLLARVTRAPFAMQLLNVALGTVTAALVAREAPLPRWARALVVLGYFPLYEYTVITRSYALELLLLCAFCARFARRRSIDGPAAVLLVLLAHTNLFGTIFAGLIVALAVLARLGRRAAVGPIASGPVLSLVAGAAALAFGHTLVQSLAIGPDHAGSYRPGLDLPWLLDCLATVTRGFVPLPDPLAYHTWNSSALDLLPGALEPWVGAATGALLVFACTRSLRRTPHVGAVFLVGSLTLLAITLFVWFGFARHHGQHAVWFLACAWIATSIAPPRPEARLGPAARATLTALLGLHVLACAQLYLRDLALPFSNARAVASYLSTPEFHDVPLVGSIDYAVEPVAGYLDRALWYPESDRFGTFLDWSERRHLVSAAEALADATSLAAGSGQDVVVILSYPWRELALGSTVPFGNRATIRYFARFEGAIVADENYHLYLASVAPSGPR